MSWNCGEEGDESVGAETVRLRDRQQRNFLCALFMSRGVPMIHMGDEYGHTKNGNNNTYCHDDKRNWLDWDAAKFGGRGLRRFTRNMTMLRRRFPELCDESFPNDNA